MNVNTVLITRSSAASLAHLVHFHFYFVFMSWILRCSCSLALTNLRVKSSYLMFGAIFQSTLSIFLYRWEFSDFRFLHIIPGFTAMPSGTQSRGFTTRERFLCYMRRATRFEILANILLTVQFPFSLQRSWNQINYKLLHLIQINFHADVGWRALLLSCLGSCTLSILKAATQNWCVSLKFLHGESGGNGLWPGVQRNQRICHA
jgi:hypothetical protein